MEPTSLVSPVVCQSEGSDWAGNGGERWGDAILREWLARVWTAESGEVTANGHTNARACWDTSVHQRMAVRGGLRSIEAYASESQFCSGENGSELHGAAARAARPGSIDG